MHSTIVWVPWKGLGQTPAIIDDQGEVLRLPLLWFAKLAKEESSPSKLRDNALGLCRFHNFWQQYHDEFKVEHDLGPATEKYDHDALFRTFWRAMRDGDPNLAWESIGHGTAEAYFRAVNQFTDWALDGTGATHPNPVVETQLSWFEQVAQYVRRIKTDMLSHIVPTGSATGIVKSRLVNPVKQYGKRHPKGNCRPGKIFALEHYHKLIIHEDKPRNLALWLELGAGGLRISEALHTFVTDVLCDTSTIEARVILSDPRYGFVETKVLGKVVEITRQDLLRQKYNLVPRDRLSRNNIQRAGWKGMKMHNPEEKTSEVIWLDGIYGQMMWAAHVQYMQLRADSDPKHPWYFVNLDHNVGEPLTASNARDLLANACKRLNLPSPHNLHALRHMYGDVSANTLKLAIQDIQVGLRHSSLLSTLIYTEPSAQTVRAAYRATKRA